MSEQIEYIEPTQEHVGQIVEVRDGTLDTWKAATLVAIINDQYRFVAKLPFYVSGLCWKHARIPRPLTYAERQAKCGLKVGDRVKVLRIAKSGEDGWRNQWLPCMDIYVGKTSTIESVEETKGFRLTDFSFTFPYFVLEKVDDHVATFNDIGKQVYVEGAPGDVFTFEIVYGIEGDVWRAVVRSGDKRFVYELSNLRVKE